MIFNDVSMILVFFAGMISFFSPCIVPIIPLYLGFLASGIEDDKDRTKKVVIRTISFVLGISVAFFILGFLFTGIGQFLGEKRTMITRISGIIIILFGLIQIGFLEFKFLKRSRRINLMERYRNMNTLNAFIMGLTFSFAWTPCVGPILSSVLILASSTKSSFLGNAMVLVYTLGFIIPFIVVGFLSSRLYDYISKKGDLLKNISKIGGVIIIVMGIMVYTGWLNNMSSYLSQFGGAESLLENQLEKSADNINKNKDVADTEEENKLNEDANTEDNESQTVPIIDFTLKDQHGNEHTLSEYKDKVVILNFWATGCPPCKKEVPVIEKAYQNYNKNQDDLVIITVVNPGGFLEGDRKAIESFMEEYGVNFPVLFDNDGSVFSSYYINSIPTTFVINRDNEILGYVPGGMTESMLESIIKEALEKTQSFSLATAIAV